MSKETKEYREKLESIKQLNDQLESKQEQMRKLRDEISMLKQQDQDIRSTLRETMEEGPDLEDESGSTAVEFPDLGKITLTAPIEKLVVVDDDAVMKTLGEDFIRIKRSLDMRKVKGFLKARNQVIDGVEKVSERQLRIRLFDNK